MGKLICICLFMLLHLGAYSQDSVVKISVREFEGKAPLPGATISVKTPPRTVVTDSLGFAILAGLPEGKYVVKVSFVGFEEQEVSFTVPWIGEIIEVLLKPVEEEEEEILVQATRTSRTIANTPTRTEVISGEELAEKGNMRPGNIQMLLNESTGIQTQVTSPSSANASIRIQGLDGRYTQILRDGLPLYAGFSGGLSIMQIAPLDLRQVEVIKGSTSTLYGGGAIAGLVNLVSKIPMEERELSFLANATTAGGLDLSGFYSEKFGKFGTTIFASRNSGSPYDPADIGLTAIPKFERYTINPRLFFFDDKTTADIGFSYITENRLGGSIDYIKEGTAGYFERNITDRFTAQLRMTHAFNERSMLNVKGSYTHFQRRIEIPGYAFEGLQQSGFAELNYNWRGEKLDWILGMNLLTDRFDEEPLTPGLLRDYSFNTVGFFVQNQWSPGEVFTLETGLRVDKVNAYGFSFLPRVSAMFRLSDRFTIRAGGGLGYKTPTVFNEEAERIQFRNILPIDPSITENEQSTGANVDLNYRTRLGDLGVSLNQLFFYTRLDRPLVLTENGSRLEFVNANGYMDTKGMETNIRLSYADFKLFIGYTYADVNTHFDGQSEWFPLTARHRLNNVLMYEKDEKWKVGFEAYYFSPQRLNDGATGRSYWILGLMAERAWERFALFVNFENFTDSRQTKFDTIYTGTIDDPTFRGIYAPLEGFIVNGGFKLRL